MSKTIINATLHGVIHTASGGQLGPKLATKGSGVDKEVNLALSEDKQFLIVTGKKKPFLVEVPVTNVAYIEYAMVKAAPTLAKAD